PYSPASGSVVSEKVSSGEQVHEKEQCLELLVQLRHPPTSHTHTHTHTHTLILSLTHTRVFPVCVCVCVCVVSLHSKLMTHGCYACLFVCVCVCVCEGLF